MERNEDNTVSDGYISDVPTAISSNYPSEISNEFKKQYSDIEEQFKGKYRVLKVCYEQRIRQLSDTLQDTCANLFSDELLNELKQDRTSSAFIPAHLAEIISRHLESDREVFIHQVLLKLSNAEVEYGKLRASHKAMVQKLSHQDSRLQSYKNAEASFAPVRERLTSLEAQYKEYSSHSEKDLTTANNLVAELKLRESNLLAQVDDLKGLLHQKSDECAQLHADNVDKSHAINVLEQSFEQSSRDLAVIEAMEKQEHALKRELREQLTLISSERNQFHSELIDVSSQLKIAQEQNKVLQQQHAVKVEEEEATRKRIAQLMSQVEGMLTQEVSDSNMAIASVHEKMKEFRQRMLSDLQREKKHSASLQERLDSMKFLADDNKRLLEETAALKTRVSAEDVKARGLQLQLDEAAKQLASLKLKLSESEYRLSTAEEKAREATSTLRESSNELEKKIRLKTESEAEEQRLILSRKEAAMKMQYENELSSYKCQLRHSYTFGSGSLVGPSDADHQHLYLLHAATEKWSKEKEMLVASHKKEIIDAEERVKSHYLSNMKLLQEKLQEARGNIDKLKAMVDSGRQSIAEKNTVIKQLNAFKNRQIELLKARSTRSSQTEEEKKPDRPKPTCDVAIEAKFSEQWVVGQSLNDSLKNSMRQSHSLSRTMRSAYFDSAVDVSEQYVSGEDSDSGTSKHSTNSNSFSRISGATKERTSSLHTSKIGKDHHNARHPTFLDSGGGHGTSNIDQKSTFKGSTNLRSSRSRSSSPSSLRRPSFSIDQISDATGIHTSVTSAAQRSSLNHTTNASGLSLLVTKLAEDLDEPMRSSTSNLPTVELTTTGKQELESASTTVFYEGKLRHQQEVTSLTNAELELARSQSLQSRQRELILLRIVAELHKLCRTQLLALRNDLAEARSVAQSISPTTAMVIHNTVSGLGMELSVIFDSIHRKQRSDLLETKVELSNAHTKELNSLEHSYIAQIGELSKKHAAELTRTHNDVMGKAERVINMVGYTSMYNSAADITALHSSQDDTQNKEESSYLQDLSSIQPQGMRRTTVPSYASVCKGMIDAVVALRIMSVSEGLEITALAQAHGEPSIAASAAAKSLLSAHLNDFILRHKLSIDAAPSTADYKLVGDG